MEETDLGYLSNITFLTTVDKKTNCASLDPLLALLNQFYPPNASSW